MCKFYYYILGMFLSIFVQIVKASRRTTNSSNSEIVGVCFQDDEKMMSK
jgi:hypothetical protein